LLLDDGYEVGEIELIVGAETVDDGIRKYNGAA
jgi:hypothetical protein